MITIIISGMKVGNKDCKVFCFYVAEK
jgi:hypothetical protein